MPIENQNLSELNAADRAVMDHLSDRNSEMLSQTIDWAKHNTGSWNAEGLLSFVPKVVEAFKALDADIKTIDTDPIERLAADGSTQYFQSGPVLRIDARPNAQAQIIMTGHYDTVFPPDTFEKIEDFGDGRIGGPGLADMKGGIIVMLEAIKAFEAGPLKSELGYQIVLTPDEETGNFASAPYLHKAASSRAQIGMTYEPAMETGAMAGARKGSAIYDITFHGLASHAGRAPEAGRSAINAAAAFTSAIERLQNGHPGVTFNIGSIDGGGAVNIVPDLAIVRLGVRSPNAEGANWADQMVNQAATQTGARDGISYCINGGFYRPPKPRNAAQSALFDAVTATGRAIDLDLEFVDTGGVCEGNNVFAAGVPNIDTLGVRGGRIHSSDEFVIAESFVERASLSALLLNRFADQRIKTQDIKSLMDDQSHVS